jgi:CheY-like chemotaxis protein
MTADKTKVPQTLLLADDSLTIQRVIELTFADEDIRVVAVSDGDQAIAELEAAPPDIVLADVAMPGKNGYQVAEFVKKSPRLAHIPVILLTGAFEPVDQARASSAGCDGVLAKPFEPQLVIGRVKELLARRPAPPSVPEPVQHSSSSLSLADQIEAAGPPPPEPRPSAEKIDDYFDRLDAAFASLTSGASHRAPLSPPTPLRSLDDDFSSLLTGSGSGSAVQATATAPAPPPPAPAAAPAPAPVITDEMVEQVARRVVEQLSDRIVREVVGEKVSAIAERLIREEIERIKASIE